ncbi:hypothetical protein DWY25_07515 [Holdemania filiformis]|uniref:PTS EIIA type-4 domain-containing protein n=1 Tax=Holdemania filiformis TaxID=61171 RepID=A0A412G3C4_9FIRM|nr:hypothetical protein [Holdemania filiformis]RGR74928.1 hypothetical protein DWY25_07515 [Holdemania filiformis]
MTEIIVIGHGHFDSGLTSALDLILGKQEHVWSIDFDEESSALILEKQMKAMIERFKDASEILIFTDLFGGTPFNLSLRMMFSNERLELMYGGNLSMFIDLCMKLNKGQPWEKVLSETINDTKNVAGYIHRDQLATTMEDDF